MLRERRLTIAVAESCSGGLLASRLTDVPGSSAYVERGVVCYSNASKTDLAGVPAALISQHGAVSEPVAQAMAEGIRARAGTDIGVGITGIAGPDGGTPEKPVGTVFFAISKRDGSSVEKKRLLVGDRAVIRRTAAVHALELLRRTLSGRAERP